jgi:4-amino-4-deoxy-L-arabinose transferase
MTSTDTPTNLNHSIRTAMFLVILAYILIYLLPLGIRPLATPDETRYGEIPHEMITTGDWAVPHLVGLRYFEKPPLGYWLNAVSLKVFGENNFAVRLPTALAAGLSAWFVWLLLVRIGYARSMALTAAAVYLGMTEVLLVGTIAVLDTPFTLFLTGGMVLFYLGVNDPEHRRHRRYLIASGISFGLAFLTKGFLALVLPGMILFVYALLQKRYKLLWTSLLVATIAIVTVLPWAIIIHLREADFWRYFIVEEHIRRFLEPNAQHPEPFYFFIAYFPATAFPWAAYLPAAIVGFRQRVENKDFLRYLLLWFFLPFIFFSISRGKLTTYILPVFAPLAAFIAIGVLNYLKAGKTRLFTLGAIINTLLLGLVLAVVLQQQYYEPDNMLFATYESQKMVILIFCIILTAVLCLLPVFIKSLYARIGIVILTIIPLFAFMNLVVPHSTLAGLSPITIIEKEKHRIKPETILVSDSNVIRAVAWELKRTDIYLLQKGELSYGLSYPDSKERFLGQSGFNALLQKHAAGQIKHDIAVFCEEPCPMVSKSLKQHGAVQHSDGNFAVWLVQGKHPHE